MGSYLTVRAVRAIVFVCLAIGAATMCATGYGCAGDNNTEKEVGHLLRIDQQIERFRNGEEFDGSIDIYVTNGEPDAKAIERLARALRTGSEPVREQVAGALVALGRQTDPLYDAGGNLIQSAAIVEVLINDGLRKPGPARDYCLEALQWSVPVTILQQHSAAIVNNTRDYPDPTAFLVLAKMKTGAAASLVDSLAAEERWRRQEETMIAKAALGDEKLEAKYVSDFVDATDPKEKASLARKLGFIGTEAALKALGGEMRSDLVIENPMVTLRSVRVDIVAALSYAFPDKSFLWDNAVLDDSGYERIEKFCEEKFGVEWKTGRPPFLWIQGFPSDIGPE